MKQDFHHKLYEKLPKVLIPWYSQNARDLPWRKTKDPYLVWISEIMLQQTRVEAVKRYYERFTKELPTIYDLAQVSEDRLLKLWEGLGYYNRVRNLQKSAQIIVEENNGVFPSEYSEILALPGIGEYTAGAICSTCFNEPVAAVDGNVLRVISRIIEDDEDILKASTKKKVKKHLELVYPKSNCGDFTQGLMELGATICIPKGKPLCNHCPAADICIAHQNGTELSLPVRQKGKKRKIQEKTVFFLVVDGKVAVRRRPDEGLLAGLWELPNLDSQMTASEAASVAASWGCEPVEIEKELTRNHIFSHIEWHMNCYYFRCAVQSDAFSWISEEFRNDEITLPTAFRQFWKSSSISRQNNVL